MSTSKGELEMKMFVASDCYNSSGRVNGSRPYMILERLWRVSTKNRFVAIGCDTHAYFGGKNGDESIGTGCISTCGSNSLITNESCSGVGCCQVAVPEGMSSFNISVSSYNNHENITDFNPCSYGFFVEEGKYTFSPDDLLDFQSVRQMPMLLNWAVGNSTCEEASKDVGNYLCKENSKCDQDYGGPGYRCRCDIGYEGNPYVGCKDIDECASENRVCVQNTTCINEPAGNYTCQCEKGYSGDGRINGTGCTEDQDQSMVTKIAVGSSAAAIFLIVFVNWLYFGLRKRKLMMLREKFFRQNGGIMLQQRISGDGGSPDQAKVFTIEELKMATNVGDFSVTMFIFV